MKITIQRPEQIGGQITKISTEKASIIIDLGHNLPNAKGDQDPLDSRLAIASLTKGCDAVLYTHYHGDHIGLCKHVPIDVPQYIDSVSRKVMMCKDKCIGKYHDDVLDEYESVKRMKTYEPNKHLVFGDIKVTPYFVSHSAAYAYMFLLEVEGKRILHTGDFRGHGLLSKGLMPTIKTFIKHVDVLITEGTMLARASEKVKPESKIGAIAKKWMREYKYVFVQCSSTDLERLAVISRATKELKRPLICDEYQKKVIDIFSDIENKGEKVFNFGDVREYIHNDEALLEDMSRNGFTMLVRPTQIRLIKSLLRNLNPRLAPKQALFIYSQWEGYINRKDTLKSDYVSFLDLFKGSYCLAPILNLHTSGHATMETLREVCETLNPSTAIIPIHREKGSDFRDTMISPELQEKIVTKDCTLNGIEISFKD